MRVATVLALGAVVGGVAQAQEAQQPVQDRDVIIVTGIGPARSSDELIANTTALSKDEVVERLNNGLGDTLASLPGVSTTAFGPGASRPVIRGLGSERVQVLTNGIGVIDASAASPDHAVTGDPLGAERIEILRGPATLAYGGGASGGVVNVIDGLIAERVPGAPVSADGYAGYTSVDEGSTLAARIEGAAGPIVAVLSATRRDAGDIKIPGYAESARLRALEEEEHEDEEDHEEHEEHEEAFGVLPNSAVDSQAISGGVSFVGSRGFVGVSVRQMESTYGIAGGHAHGHEHEEGEEEEEEHEHEHGEELPFIDMKQTRYDLRGGLRFDDGLVRRVSAAISVVDYEHTEFEAPGEPGTIFTNEGYEGRVEVEHASLAGLVGSVGLQASRRDFRAVGDEAFVTPTVTEQAGVFIFETLEMGEWGLEGGLRFDRVELDNAVAGKLDFETFNASFGVHGHATPDLFLGLSLNLTERAPTDVELFASGPHLATQQFEIGDATLETETSWNLEGTVRWQSGPLRLSGSVYRYRFDNFIYLEPTGDVEDGLPVFQAVQRDAVFTGGELSAALELGDTGPITWRADGAIDFVEGRTLSLGDLPRIPPATTMLGVEAKAGGLRARLEGRWAADQKNVAAFELPTDGYAVADLRVTYSLTDRISVIAEGLNLTDEEVRMHASPLKDVAPMAGRSVRIGLRAGF